MTAYSFKYLTGNEKMPFSRFPVPFFSIFPFFISYVILGFESTGYAPREYIFSTNEFFSRGIEILESLTSRYHDATAAVHFVQAVRKKCPFFVSPSPLSLSLFLPFSLSALE